MTCPYMEELVFDACKAHVKIGVSVSYRTPQGSILSIHPMDKKK